MNLDFRSEQALAGARAFQRAQYAQRSDAQPSPDVLEPAAVAAPDSELAQHQHAA